MKNLQKEYERIQKYVSSINVAKYDLYESEMNAIFAYSSSKFELMLLAFKFGFAKGCRKTKRAVKAND